MDHKKTWRFWVAASPEDCRAAFEAAVTARSGLKLRAVNWHLRREAILPRPGGEPVEASIATYTGRAGFAAATTASIGARAEKVEAGAIGSEMAFVVDHDESSPQGTSCSLWMRKSGSWFGFTNDAGYFRSYMNDVEKNLRALDPNLTVTKQ